MWVIAFDLKEVILTFINIQSRPFSCYRNKGSSSTCVLVSISLYPCPLAIAAMSVLRVSTSSHRLGWFSHVLLISTLNTFSCGMTKWSSILVRWSPHITIHCHTLTSTSLEFKCDPLLLFFRRPSAPHVFVKAGTTSWYSIRSDYTYILTIPQLGVKSRLPTSRDGWIIIFQKQCGVQQSRSSAEVHFTLMKSSHPQLSLQSLPLLLPTSRHPTSHLKLSLFHFSPSAKPSIN